MPGGASRAKQDWEEKFAQRKSYGRKAYAEMMGPGHKALNWDSSILKKHDIALGLPPGVQEKIQRKAWRDVEQMFNPANPASNRPGVHPSDIDYALNTTSKHRNEMRSLKHNAEKRLREHIRSVRPGTVFPPIHAAKSKGHRQTLVEQELEEGYRVPEHYPNKHPELCPMASRRI